MKVTKICLFKINGKKYCFEKFKNIELHVMVDDTKNIIQVFSLNKKIKCSTILFECPLHKIKKIGLLLK